MFKLFQVFDGAKLNGQDTFEFDGPQVIRIDTVIGIEYVTDRFSLLKSEYGQILVLGNFIKIAREIEEMRK